MANMVEQCKHLTVVEPLRTLDGFDIDAYGAAIRDPEVNPPQKKLETPEQPQAELWGAPGFPGRAPAPTTAEPARGSAEPANGSAEAAHLAEKHPPPAAEPEAGRFGIPLCFIEQVESTAGDMDCRPAASILGPLCPAMEPCSDNLLLNNGSWRLLEPRPAPEPMKRPAAAEVKKRPAGEEAAPSQPIKKVHVMPPACGDASREETKGDTIKVWVCHPKRDPKGSYIQYQTEEMPQKRHLITISHREHAHHANIIETTTSSIISVVTHLVRKFK